MAFARASPTPLSLNTAATNSLFAQQQQQQTQAPTGSSLFPPANNTTPAAGQTSSVFGNTNNSAPASQPANTSSIFGGASHTQPPAPAGGGGLFGSAQPDPAPGGGLFGSRHQPSLFTNNTTTTTTTTNNNSPSNNMFAKPAQPAQPGSSLFAAPANAGTNSAGGGLFGASATAQSKQQAPSLLGATQHAHMSQSAPFGRLSMGQGASQPQAQAASQVQVDNLRPTTRFEDCADNVKKELEDMDTMIKQQEEYARQIEAFLPKHADHVNSLQPDIALIKDKAEDVEQSLAADARAVDAQRQLADKDKKDFQRIQRVAENLQLPPGYQYPSAGLSGFGGMYASQQRPHPPPSAPEGEDPAQYDTDLIGNYFVPMASELQQTVAAYCRTLADMEQHLRVVEESTVAQAQQLAQREAGITAPTRGDPTAREIAATLAATLRGFEGGILSVASVVGECRDGLTQLALGRIHATGGS